MTQTTACITLSMLAAGRLGLNDAKALHDMAGSATAVLENRNDIRSIAPEASDRLCEIMKQDITDVCSRAEEEERWCNDHGIKMLCIDDADYPSRLKHCADAPLVLYVRGDANLNASHAIDIVGTRQCTPYGRDVIDKIIGDLATLCPGITINSGLAYGVDIAAHRAALQHSLPTVGVVAHGHDTLYPALHKKEASEMINNGGAVITEYPRGTRPEARNFLQRNRIIAGISDATIVIESASHGGGLVTARIALDYGREVFAVPGPVNAEYSKGCNNLIRDNKAQLITSAQDIVNVMGWQHAEELQKARQAGISRSMFAEETLTDGERLMVRFLREHGDSQVNDMAAQTGMSISTINSALFSLEMQGIVKPLSGNFYHLIG